MTKIIALENPFFSLSKKKSLKSRGEWDQLSTGSWRKRGRSAVK